MTTEYVQEILAMSLIGDGVLTAVDPERHLKLWRTGPEPFGRFIDMLLRHTHLTRAMGAAAVIAGIFWASRLKARPSTATRSVSELPRLDHV